MAGHSKWANIKHKKAREDAKKGKIFSKLVKKISSAARRGGGNPDDNPELRLMIEKARAANMPSDNIERAILKATGQLEGVSYEEFVYEGYGPGGVAILLEGSTDNRNRTVGEIRHAFSKSGGNLGENGCVGWLFETRGTIVISREQVDDLDALMMTALEHGAEDVEEEDGLVTISCPPEDFVALREGLVAAGHETFVSDEITKLPQNEVKLDLDEARSTMKLLDYFEDHDDIENVYSNLDVDEDVAAQL